LRVAKGWDTMLYKANGWQYANEEALPMELKKCGCGLFGYVRTGKLRLKPGA